MTTINTVTKLLNGGHKSREEGMCLLEAVAFIAGEPHSDHPACTDPVLGAFGRAVNDFMTDNERQLLIPIVPKLVGTAGDHTLSLRRAMLICDGTIRQILPMAFDALDPKIAASLRALGEIKDQPSASAARSAAESAWSAAWSAARSAAESAASAAESAARSAAASAARSAAESAASAARLKVCEALVSIFSAAIEIK